jgi:hypothetical protein
MTGYDSKRRMALDRLDDDDIQVYAQPEGKIMTEEEARTLEAMKYAASMGYPSSMLKDMFAPFTIKRGVVMAQPEQEPLTDKQILADETLRYYFGQNGGAGPVSKQGRRVVDAIEAAHGIKEKNFD